MDYWGSSTHLKLKLALLILLLLLLLLHLITPATAIRPANRKYVPIFQEAPAFRNGEACAAAAYSQEGDNKIHITMTLDTNYVRGTIAAIFSILQHSACPERLSFHFLFAHFDPDLIFSIKSTFPYLKFEIYPFDSKRVLGKISKSIRQALDQPLNYARIYLADDIVQPDVKRVIYLDSDLVVFDDIAKLSEVDLEDKVLAAPEYCHANFTKYFTYTFWSDPELRKVFEGRSPCYFNTGVMVMDVDRWRKGGYTLRVEEWMNVQKKKRIYELGSLPPFLLVLAGEIKPIDYRWNQHGLGGDNIEGKCRNLHPGPVSLLHWSGKGKPWLRSEAGKPCAVDTHLMIFIIHQRTHWKNNIEEVQNRRSDRRSLGQL